MIKVNQDTKNAYKAYGGHKEVEIRIPALDITLTNTDILSQSLSLTEAIESSENLTFTGCIASCLKFKCADIVQDIKGQYIECDITAGDTQTIPLFRGYIDSVTNSSHEQMTMDITAYDALYKINEMDVTSWYNSLTFPITIANMRNSFFNYVGITQEADYLPNDPMTVNKTIDNKTVKGSDIIKPICQINGRYGRIGRTGVFQYVHLVEGTEALYPREDLYPADDLYPSAENALDNVSKAHYMGINFENYRVSPIDKVQLIGKDGSIVATAGSGTNIFTVDNNPFIFEKSSAELLQVATNLYNTIQGLWYTPTDVQCVGLPYVETGDFVMCTTKRSIIRAYVLNRTLNGIQALKDDYKAEGDKTQPEYTPSIQTQVNANANAIRTESVRAFNAEQLNANNISATNARCGRIEADVGSFKNLTANNFSAVNASINNLSADVANVNSLVANKANISDLQASNARIQNLEATRVTASQVNSIVASSLRTFSGTLYCNSISVGGTTFSHGRTINLFNSSAQYYGQATVLTT